MRNIFALLVSFFMLPMLVGCGFEPMASVNTRQADNKILAKEMASVDIKVQTARDKRYAAQVFRTELEDLTNPGQLLSNEKRYSLHVNLGSIVSPGFIAPDGKAQRFLVNLQSSYRLVRLSDGKVIEQGSLNRSSSYSNLPNSYFSTYVAEQDTLKRLAEQLAEEYRLKIASVLTTPPAEPTEEQQLPLRNNTTPPKSAIIVPGV